MKIFKFIIGLCLGIIVFLTPFSQFQAAPLESVRNLPVQLEGRKKPLDTVARETVMQIHGRANYQAADGKKLDYLQTYLSLWSNNRDWNQEPFILFNYRPLKTQLGLDPEQKYFTFAELMQSDLGSVIMAAREKQADEIDLNRDDTEALTIEERLALTVATVGSPKGLAAASDRLPIIPHPTDAKGKWLSIDEASNYYPESVLQPSNRTILISNRHIVRVTIRKI